jgi:pimeloyl-ACP methyl ester carboxylesterase
MEVRKEQNESERPSVAFPFESRYVDVLGHRIHYIEEGRGAPILYVHGNPTSSYLWRNVLPAVAANTHRRGIALDLPGFGRSGKMVDGNYTLDRYYKVLEGFIERLDLKDLILVLHDWGGPLGMMYAARHRGNVKAIALMETFLWDTAWRDYGKFRAVFKLLRSPAGYLIIQVMNLFVNNLLPGSVLRKKNMTGEVMDLYRQPFPTVASRRPIRLFPQLIPIEGRPEASRLFIEEIEDSLRRLDVPVLWIKATPGAIITENTAYRLVALAARIPKLAVKEFGPGLHYLQEDDPKRLVGLITGWIKAHSLHNVPSEAEGRQLDAA